MTLKDPYRKAIYSFACVLPVILYILTASRTLPWGDGAEFYVAVRNLGIPHPSGYPLFLLLGRAFYLISSAPFLLNLLPGLITACAVYFLYRIIVRITDAPLAGLALALSLATGRAVWQQSVAAEVYTLNMFMFTALLYLVIETQTTERFVIPAFLIAGLALTDHLTSVFYVLPCCAYLIISRPHRARYAPVILAPLLLYLYFPIRSHADPLPDLFDPETAGRFIAYVSGRPFLYRAFSLARTSLFPDILEFLRAWWQQFVILIPLGFYGIFRIRDRLLRVVLGCTCLFVVGYALLYHIPDKQGYYLPFYAAWTVFIGVAAVKLLPRKFLGVLFIIPLLNVAANYRFCNLSRETSLDDLGSALYATLPDSSLFFSDDYFVHYDMVNRTQSAPRGIIPINQFYLRMDWYINSITARYPGLVVPGTVLEVLKDCDEALKEASPEQYGEISKRCCQIVQHEIVQANIDTRPACYFMYNDDHWPQRLYDLFLQYRGLYYQYRRDSLPPEIFALNVPSPDRYRVDRLTNQDEVYCARKFAAAYNRRGIYRSLHSDFDGAIADLSMALRYYPGYYQVYANLGIMYLSAGDTTRALEAWRSYIDLAPAGSQRDRIQAWYDALRQTMLLH